MDYRELSAKTVAELRSLARDENIHVPSSAKKAEIVDLLLEVENARAAENARRAAEAQRAAEEKLAQAAAKAAAEEQPKRRKSAPAEEKAPASEEPKTASGKKGGQAGQEKRAAASAKPKTSGEKPAQAAAPAPAEQNRQKSRRQAEQAGQIGAESPASASQQAPSQRRAPEASGDNGSGQRQQNQRRYDQQPRQNGRQQGEQPRYPFNSNRNNDQRPSAGRQQDGNDQQRYQRRQDFVPQDPTEVNQAVSDMLATGECSTGEGLLEIMSDGYGFLRAENCQPGPRDTYVSMAQIRRFNLRTGDHVSGRTRPQREGDRYSALLYIDSINGESPEKAVHRPRFDSLTPIYPDERIRLERQTGRSDMALRVIDMLAPIGRGQRAMIVSQPKAGKTVLLKKIANAVAENCPDIHVIVLLIDERPEEVTDMQRSIQGEVVYSTFDEVPENHTRVAEMVLEHSQRMVESGQNVLILLDSITRLARAYNLVIPPTGRTLSGGMDPGALHKPKRFFGAARNIENGGSLTIVATALVETGSRMDDIIYEEFKGTGNSEIHLDRKLSEKRIFPAIDMNKSGTRREDLLLTPEELEGEYAVRRMLSNNSTQDTAEQMLGMLEKTSCNAEFFQRLKGWIAVWEKEGYTLGGR